MSSPSGRENAMSCRLSAVWSNKFPAALACLMLRTAFNQFELRAPHEKLIVWKQVNIALSEGHVTAHHSSGSWFEPLEQNSVHELMSIPKWI